MSDAAFRGLVPAGNGTVVVQCNHNKQNIRWVVWQLSVECSNPTSQGQVDSVRRNGRLITSSFILPSSAQGPPAIVLDGNDNLDVKFTGLNAGEEAIVTLYYEEIQVGQQASQFGAV